VVGLVWLIALLGGCADAPPSSDAAGDGPRPDAARADAADLAGGPDLPAASDVGTDTGSSDGGGPAPTLWVTAAGGEKWDEPSDMVLDGSGNIYVIGDFWGVASFGAHKLVSKGDSDVFVAKLDPSGTFSWAVSAGSVGFDAGRGIGVDAAGNVFVTGSFVGGASFGPHVLSAGAARNIFVARLDPAGSFTWATTAQASAAISGHKVAVDPQGAVFVAGEFKGQPTLGTTTLSAMGSTDWLVARLDAAGSFTWAVSGGGSQEDGPWGLTLDAAGQLLITGYQDGSTYSAYKVFVARLSPTDGKLAWSTPLFAGIPVGGVAADPGGGCYVTGHYQNTVTFGTTTLTSQGITDTFVARLDDKGQPLWAASSGGTGWDMGWGIGAASGGGAFVAGKYQSSAAFGSTMYTSKGSNDVFLSRLDAAGAHAWTVSAGGSGNDSPCRVAQDSQGDVIVAGTFEGSAPFGSKTATSHGESDVFVWKLDLK